MRSVAVALAVCALAGCVEPSTPPDVGVSTSPADFEESSAFGRVVSAERLGDGRASVALEAAAVDCRREARAWNATFLAGEESLPAPGSEAGLNLYRSSDGWHLQRTFGSLAAYAEACAPRREHDVQAVPVPGRLEGPPGSAVSIPASPVPLGARVPVDVTLRSVAPVEARLSNLTLVNDEARAAIAGCRVEGPDAPLLVDGERTVRVVVECDADAEPRPTYESCGGGWSPGLPGEEPSYEEPSCRDVRATRSLASVRGVLAFTDELGGGHARETDLRQMLHVGPDATLTLRVPERVDSRDAFVVEAEYRDAEGRPIDTAQVTMRIDWPGLEDHGFGMFRDEATGVWRFTWEDFHERKPVLWREGTRTVSVEASDFEGGHVPRGATAEIVFA